MKESILLPILRSQTQGDLLALLFLNPKQEFTLTQAAHRIGVSLSGLHHEAVRLLEARFIKERRIGRNRMISAEIENRIAAPLTDLLALTFGPLPVLERELAGIRGISSAYIFGSWAARYQGISGELPQDIDLLIIGTASLDELEDATQRGQKILLRDVNIARYPVKAWKESNDKKIPTAKKVPFLLTLRSKPLVELMIQ